MSLKTLSVALLFLAAFHPASNASAPGVPLDGIAAVVNEDVILRSELRRRTDAVLANIAAQGGGQMPPMDVLHRQVLERLILERLQLQRAENMGITVPEDRLNQTISNIARSNGMTLEQFAAAVEADGLSFAEVREDIRQDMILSQLRQRDVLARVHVSPREVDAFLAGEGAGALDSREFRVQHIMLRADPDQPAEIERARALGEEIVRRARAGEDFGSLAVAHSAGQQALEGGDLGWRRSTQLPAAFAERVVAMQPGAVSDLIRTPGALHVLKLNEVRGGGERVVINQTHARHILLRTNPIMTDARAAARLAELRTEIIEGRADFGDLARRHSEDPGSAINNGDLGWLDPGQTVPAFEQMMDSLAVGDVSEPFASDFGWHIVQVIDRRTHDGTDQMRVAQARQILRERKAEEEYEEWLMHLRSDAYIENRLGG